MNLRDKIELYNKAKEAYYNGQEIMTDFEFDALEKELGLENKSIVGTKHNPSYTIKHPLIMGSISKVQIHKDKDGNIDWDKYFNEAKKYFGDNELIITPKYDGCSFEVDIDSDEGEPIQSISSRGDGNYGKDLKDHLYEFIPEEFTTLGGHYILRGEVLVKKDIFENKYSEKFTNPRSFVSGVLNRDYNRDDKDFMEMLNDLSIVIYDYRRFEDGEWVDKDFIRIGSFINAPLPKYYMNNWVINTPTEFSKIYEKFTEYRHNCEYALDGIVIKPIDSERINNTTERRPKDCIAIKFIPMLEETEVINITWNLGKTGEFTPIIWVKPVEMDGRMVQKCSGHNLGYLRQKGITVGAKIIMSLAGDIIPFMYKVTDPNENGEIPMPENYNYYEDDIHLMAILTEKDMLRNMFINSSVSLNIPNIGPETAKKIFEYLDTNCSSTMEFFGEIPSEMPFNILMCSSEDIYFGVGCGRAGEKAKKSFEEVVKNISLVDIIKSCNFRFCGSKVAEQCANYMLNGEADFEHLAKEGYEWVIKDYSDEKNDIYKILEHLGKSVDDFKIIHETQKEISSNQIPIIMTGEPNDYKSKGEFLSCHPEYRNTGSWKEVQIVFTNSLESNTGKMKKAKEKGIEIRLY